MACIEYVFDLTLNYLKGNDMINSDYDYILSSDDETGWRGIAEIIDCSLDVPNGSINHIITRPISYIPSSPVIRTAAFISFF